MAVDPKIEGFDQFREIGRGAFGIVYRARQIELDREVAIKVLVAARDAGNLTRFDRERRAMGALSSHPNVVTVHATGSTEHGQPYIVMEYAPFGSLARRLDEHGPVPWPEALDIGAKLADALESAHRAGVLHRDIKPENILVSGRHEPMLSDFGIARLAGGTETRTGIITASIAHAPPEVLNGQRPAEGSDVYSLASTLYSLLAGNAPFVRDTDESITPVIARIATQDPPDLRPLGVPDSAWQVLATALAKDPARRHDSAATFGEDLRVAAGTIGNDTVTVPPPPAHRLPETPEPPASDRRTAASWSPTHVVPRQGLVTYAGSENGDQPNGRLDPGLDVQLTERHGDWAHIVCSNGWSAWVDARQLREGRGHGRRR